MPAPDLARLVGGPARPRPRLTLGPGVALALGRAHEACGPSRAAFAALAAGAAATGPVLWIRGPRTEGRLDPDGLARFLDPARLVLAAPRREEDVLWCAEEALRAGAAPVVIAEVAAAPRLTPVRRLHLAAEAGAEAAAADGGGPPLALLLTPGDGGAEGVETRWRLSPTPTVARRGGDFSGGEDEDGTGAAADCWPAGGPPAWRLERLRARRAPPAAWRAEGPSRPGGPLRLDPAAPPEPAGAAASRRNADARPPPSAVAEPTSR